MIKKIVKKVMEKLPDKIFIQIKYLYIFKRVINLNHPKTFNEKLQWLKLYDRKMIYTNLVDKIAVKEYVKNRLKEDCIIPTLAIFDNVEDIDINTLPSQFVLKTNHDSGSVIRCKDKANFDIENAKIRLKKALNRDYSIHSREWPYKNISRKILVEKYMIDESFEELIDYKVFCFNGEPKFIQLDYDRYTNHGRTIYDIDWNILPVTYRYKHNENKYFNRPEELNKILEYSRELSKSIPFVRVDFYIVKNQVYFGEMTLYPLSGFGKFKPEIYDIKFGEFLNLNEVY